MSSSKAIAIPKRKQKRQMSGSLGTPSTPTSSSCTASERLGGFAFSSYASSSTSSTFATLSSASSVPQSADMLIGRKGKGKEKEREGGKEKEEERRRESLMSPTFSTAEYTVINVGEEEAPRLISCVKRCQGWDWNQEIFLPSYADYAFDDLERRQDPVEEIFVSEEEMRGWFPS